ILDMTLHKSMSEEELELLRKLDEENRKIEEDLKSAMVLTSQNTRSPDSSKQLTNENNNHSRHDSISSDLSSLTFDAEGTLLIK
ncbi:unnamed protein product, partial [Didymodactylos carnosus]